MQVSLLSLNLSCRNTKNNMNSCQQAGARTNMAFGQIVKNNLSKVLNVAEEGIKDKFVCVVSGPSGVGKDTVINEFDRLHNFFARVVTCTTRKPRPGEIDGVNYHFLSPDEFRKGIENNEFIEFVNVYTDTFYGTRKKDIDAALATGKNAVMAIDVDGAMKVKKERSDILMMFITPPSMKELAARLRGRGTETAKAVSERLQKAKYELSFKDKYDVILQNDDFHKSVEEMAEIFHVKK